jgi:RsmE family RNA methyltransferase
MNLLLFKQSECRDNILVLADRRAGHIVNILRLSTGDSMRVGEINGLTGTGTIEKITDSIVTLRVDLQEPPPPIPNVELILALPRPIMLQRILKQATVLGISAMHLIRSRRVEKSFFHSPVLKPEKIEHLLIEGLEQAVDTRLPEVLIYHRFKPFVEDVVPSLEGVGLLAHPETTLSLTDIDEQNTLAGKKILLAIGPEGGWSEYECQRFQDQGFAMFTMGPRILHVDTAVVALLAQLAILRT